MYLTNKTPFKIIKGLDKTGTPAQVKFDGITFTAYMDRFEFESLLIGKELRKAGVGDLILAQLQDLIEQYGQNMRDEGYTQGMDNCCGSY